MSPHRAVGRRPRGLLLCVVLFLVGTALTAIAPPAGADVDPVGTWPLRPEPDVVRGFDPPDVVWGAGHRGVDLLGHVDQAVRAALPGVVTYAGLLAGRGVVVVGHGDTRTTYEPVTATVEVGASVSRGSVIGRLASTLSHCPPRVCLHWGWLRGEVYLDPLDLVGGGPVRLLPFWPGAPVAPVAPAWSNPYAAILVRLAELAELARAPPRG